MRRYHAMLSALEGYLSIETAGSPDDMLVFETRMSSDPRQAERMRRDVLESLSDPSFYWKLALWNEDSHIEEFETEHEARGFVEELILPAIERACESR